MHPGESLDKEGVNRALRLVNVANAMLFSYANNFDSPTSALRQAANIDCQQATESLRRLCISRTDVLLQPVTEIPTVNFPTDNGRIERGIPLREPARLDTSRLMYGERGDTLEAQQLLDESPIGRKLSKIFYVRRYFYKLQDSTLHVAFIDLAEGVKNGARLIVPGAEQA